MEVCAYIPLDRLVLLDDGDDDDDVSEGKGFGTLLHEADLTDLNRSADDDDGSTGGVRWGQSLEP